MVLALVSSIVFFLIVYVIALPVLLGKRACSTAVFLRFPSWKRPL